MYGMIGYEKQWFESYLTGCIQSTVTVWVYVRSCKCPVFILSKLTMYGMIGYEKGCIQSVSVVDQLSDHFPVAIFSGTFSISFVSK